MKPGRYASIDIGTVTCRLLVADVSSDGSLATLEKGYRITNLGEGVDATGMLKPEAMKRVSDAVAEFQKAMVPYESEEPIRLTVMATSASRDASNAHEFQQIMANQGIELAVIPGHKEASLTFRGASCDFIGQPVMVVDIGGGSTEIVVGVAGEDPALSHSFNIGCRRVTERFLHDDPPSPDQIQEARDWIRQEMAPFFDKIHSQAVVPQRMVAVAGTATSVVSVHKAMEVYDSALVQGVAVTHGVLDGVYERLSVLPLEQRKTVVGLDPGRAPVFVAGLIILQEVVRLSGLDGFTASESDILQGIILDAAQ